MRLGPERWRRQRRDAASIRHLRRSHRRVRSGRGSPERMLAPLRHGPRITSALTRVTVRMVEPAPTASAAAMISSVAFRADRATTPPPRPCGARRNRADRRRCAGRPSRARPAAAPKPDAHQEPGVLLRNRAWSARSRTAPRARANRRSRACGRSRCGHATADRARCCAARARAPRPTATLRAGPLRLVPVRHQDVPVEVGETVVRQREAQGRALMARSNSALARLKRSDQVVCCAPGRAPGRSRSRCPSGRR